MNIKFKNHINYIFPRNIFFCNDLKFKIFVIFMTIIIKNSIFVIARRSMLTLTFERASPLKPSLISAYEQ